MNETDGQLRRWTWVSWLWIVAAASLMVLLSASHDVNLYDEGVILTAATRVAEGAVPHRDFYANYGPAQFYALACLFKIFGPSVLTARLWGAFIKGAIVASVYLLCRRLMPPLWGWITVISCLIWLAALENSIWPAWPALLVSLASILLLFSAVERPDPARCMLAAGLCVGVATTFRYDIGFFLFAAETLVLLFRFRTHVRVLLGYWTGIALILLPVAVVYLLTGALRDFIFDVVVFPSSHYAATRGLPFPTLDSQGLTRDLYEYIVYVPLMAALAAAVHFITDPQRRNWMLLLLASITLLFYLKGVVRVAPLHMAIAIVPSLVLLMGLISATKQAPRSVWLAGMLILAAALAAVCTLAAATRVGAAIGANVDLLMGPLRAPHPLAALRSSCEKPPGLERLTCFDVDRSQMAAIRYVQARTEPGNPVFVALPRHDKVFVNDVAFYFLSALRPATKWYHFDPGLQTSDRIQKEIINDLEGTIPAFVVLDSEWDGITEPNDSSVSSGVHLLDVYISGHYSVAAVFGNLTVMGRTGAMPVRNPGLGLSSPRLEVQPAVN